MPIIYDESKKIFYMHTKNTSYIAGFVSKYFVHAYWGKRVNEIPSVEAAAPYCPRGSFSACGDKNEPYISADTLPLEFPVYGNPDLRSPAFHAEYYDGSSVTELCYASHKIINGKPKLEGLPSAFAGENEAQTLEVCLHDEKTDIDVYLTYTVFEEKDAITRSVKVENNGKSVVNISKILSASVDFYSADFDMISLPGAWGRERRVQRTPLSRGAMIVDSKRGASSHQMNPFIALADKKTTENSGDIYGMNFVYSGNFTAGTEVDQYGMARMFMGLNPFDFNWRLESGETFTAPEVVMVYSNSGIGGMSRIYHNLYRNNLCRGKYAKTPRPVLINNWEATYFDFNEEKIVNIAKKAKEIGVELMVLDDGWFGSRNNDKSSLGDWFVNETKLPNGISGLAEKIEALGMKFGLWFEPEMISPVSRLYEMHPDWCLHVPGRARSEGRNQLVLDYSNKDVCDYIINTVGEILRNAKISYVKWDMNRHMTEIGSAYLPAERQRETAHRYMLGLYYVLETLVTEFDTVLFESCSGGGGRFDPGMLYYMPQTWTSDNSDAIERLYIQYGTSIAYPAITMGAHVSAVPNHQVHRVTPIEIRGDVAAMGQFGFELDLNRLNADELQKAKECVEQYKNLRNIVHFGDMYRLASPFESNHAVWQFISEDKNSVAFFCFNILAEVNGKYWFIKAENLDPESMYKEKECGIELSGAALMNIGLPIMSESDFGSRVYLFEKMN